MRVCPKCDTKTDAKICPDCGIATIDEAKFQQSASDPAHLIGRVLMGRYEVVKLLGRGGMGDVYYGIQKAIARKCAIKVLKTSLLENLDAVKRFHREVLLASSLNHPNIVNIYDFGRTEDGLLFMVMEVLQGESLRAVLNREGQMEPYRVASIVMQVAKALIEAHSKGMVHRDLKPENIFIRTFGDEEVVKVLDFGIAKLLGNDSGETLTRDGMVIGSPEYMSPEQAAGQAVDLRSDLYSLGMIGYEMLTGFQPFKRGTHLATLVAQKTDPLPPFDDEIRRLCSPPFLDIINTLLKKEPDQRIQSALQVASAIRHISFKRVKVTAGNMRVQDDEGPTVMIETPLTNSEMDSAPKIDTDGSADLDDSDSIEFFPGKSRWPVLVVGFAVAIAVGLVAFVWFNPGNASQAARPAKIAQPVVKKPVQRVSIKSPRKAAQNTVPITTPRDAQTTRPDLGRIEQPKPPAKQVHKAVEPAKKAETAVKIVPKPKKRLIKPDSVYRAKKKPKKIKRSHKSKVFVPRL